MLSAMSRTKCPTAQIFPTKFRVSLAKLAVPCSLKRKIAMERNDSTENHRMTYESCRDEHGQRKLNYENQVPTYSTRGLKQAMRGKHRHITKSGRAYNIAKLNIL